MPSNSGGGRNPVWNIETRECGVWETVETAHSKLEAFRIASNLTLTTREEWIKMIEEAINGCE